MTSLVRILFFGALFLVPQFYKAQNIDSSYLGTYVVILNNLKYDTAGYIKIASKTYSFYSMGTNTVEYNRTYLDKVSGEYAIKNYENTIEKDSLNHYTIDFDPKNDDRTWRQYLHSTLELNGSNSEWHLWDNTSSPFPKYIFIKTE